MPRVRRSYIEAASQIVSNRVGDNSKNNYKGKINTMKLYLLHNHDGHGLDAANNLNQPLDANVVIHHIYH